MGSPSPKLDKVPFLPFEILTVFKRFNTRILILVLALDPTEVAESSSIYYSTRTAKKLDLDLFLLDLDSTHITQTLDLTQLFLILTRLDPTQTSKRLNPY